MTLLREVATYPRDAAALDAFGRMRVSNTNQRLDVEFLYNKQPDYFDEITNNGTVTFNGAGRDLTLSLADAASGSFATMASYPVPYTPGNSQLIDITGVLDMSALGTGTAEVFLRSTVTGSTIEEVITQADWLNASSGVDWSKSHIFAMDFQSLKVGSIRYGLVSGGKFIPIAQIDNDNERSGGYWQIPNLPVCYRIYNDATHTYAEMAYGNEFNAIGIRYKVAVNATATMKAICCTVKSEGGPNIGSLPGLPRSIDTAETVKPVANTVVPLMSIRCKDTYLTYDNLILAVPKSFNIQTDNPIRLIILHSTILTGAIWTDVDAIESSVEYDISATSLANGHVIYSEYLATVAKNSEASNAGILGKTVLWNRQGSETGTFTIAAIRTTTTSADCLVSIQWDELR